MTATINFEKLVPLYRNAYLAFQEKNTAKFLTGLSRLDDEVRRQLRKQKKLTAPDIQETYAALTHKVFASDNITTIDSDYLSMLTCSTQRIRDADQLTHRPAKKLGHRAAHLTQALVSFGGARYIEWSKSNYDKDTSNISRIIENDAPDPSVWNYFLPKKIKLEQFQTHWKDAYSVLQQKQFGEFLIKLQALDSKIRKAVGKLDEPLRTTAVNVVYANLYLQASKNETAPYSELLHLKLSLYWHTKYFESKDQHQTAGAVERLYNASNHFLHTGFYTWQQDHTDLVTIERGKVFNKEPDIHKAALHHRGYEPPLKFNTQKAVNIGASSVAGALLIAGITLFVILETNPATVMAFVAGSSLLLLAYAITMLISNVPWSRLFTSNNKTTDIEAGPGPGPGPRVSPALGKVSNPDPSVIARSGSTKQSSSKGWFTGFLRRSAPLNDGGKAPSHNEAMDPSNPPHSPK